jgi:hypothetical protein
MKKLWFLPLAFILVFSLTGCTEDVSVGSSSSDSSAASSSKAPKEKIHKQVKLNFSNTSAQQTTKVDSAEIRDVTDLNLVDNEFDQVKYALLVHMSVSNKAPDAASTYPSQGHVVLEDGTQIEGLVGADVNIDDAFKDGEIANGATVSGYVVFPLKEDQAEKFTKGAFKFSVLAGDEMFTEKNYTVDITF